MVFNSVGLAWFLTEFAKWMGLVRSPHRQESGAKHGVLSQRIRRKTALVVFASLAVTCIPAAFGQILPAEREGPPSKLTFKGFVRVIDASTFDVFVSGNRVGIGLVGVKPSQANTECGKSAIQTVNTLLRNATLTFDQGSAPVFDARKRRMYHVKFNGESLARKLVQMGLADVTQEGDERAELNDDKASAQAARTGCVLDASKQIPLPPAIAGSQQDALQSRALAPRAVVNTNVVLPTGFTSETVASGLTFPTNFAFLPDGRILVLEKSGIVKLFKNGALLSTPFINLSSRVNAYWDHGLLGVAVDPGFATNGFVYFLYTFENDALNYDQPKTSRLTRVTASGDTAPLSSELVLLGTTVGAGCGTALLADCISSDNPSHSIGSVRAAQDGTLWVTAGDGASFNGVDDDALRAQNLDTLNGKLLHITNTGAGLPSNPFWNGTSGANRSKVWAYGLRNPYRFNLSPFTQTPYIGDVGWGTWEELNLGFAGSNFGWPCYEGASQQPGYAVKAVCQSLYGQGTSVVTMPLFAYNHFGYSAASTGGAFYTGSSYPARYQNRYFHADYAQSWIRFLQVNSADQLVSGPEDFLFNGDGPVSVQMGPDGYLYYVSISTGELRRIVYSGPADTTAPAVLSTTPVSGATNISVGSPVTVVFSELMSSASVNTSTFTLTRAGTPVAATVASDGSRQSSTLTPAAGLLAGTSYTATVKGGASGVKDSAGNPLAADLVWSFTTSALPPGTGYLSDRSWSSATNGSGPVEIDRSNGESAAGDGNPLRLNGQTFAKGLGVHAVSEIHYSLSGACSAFSASVGIDDETEQQGSAIFQVFGDSTKLFDSGVMQGGMAPLLASVSLTGRNELVLKVLDSGSQFRAHGDWANALLTCTAGAAPSVTATTPADGTGGVAVTTPITATFSQAMNATTLSPGRITLVRQGTSTSLPITVSYDAATLTARIYPTAGLAAAATYQITIKGGSSGVTAAGGTPMAADKVWGFTTAALPAGATYLSDRAWASAANGYGPVEKDMSNGEAGAGDGKPITLRGTAYLKGLGMHASADVTYNVTGCNLFTSDVGVDDEVGLNGSVVFQVWTDGVLRYDSGTVTGGTAPKQASVSLVGKSVLRLVVTDAGNGIASDHADWANALMTCGVTNTPPTPVITSPSPSLQYKVGDVITLSGSATDAEDGSIPASGLSWQIIIHHCPGGSCHIHPLLTLPGATGSFTVPDHGDASYFEIILQATDSGGSSATKTININPQTTSVTVASTPAGLQVVYGGTTFTAPTTQTSIVGSTITLLAPSPQGTNNFASWSDGGAQQHNVVVGAASATYTATFTQTASPAVTSTNPASSATGVPVNTTVSATFSSAMQVASLTTSTVTLVRQGTTVPLGATVAYNGTNQTVTLTPAAALAAGTVYTATVKGGTSGAKSSTGTPMAADFSWSFTTAAAGGTSTFLSDLTWTSAVNGWGPVEKDLSNGEQGAGDGTPIKIAGVVYPKGLGVHASSDVRYGASGCTAFTTDVGVDAEVGTNGSVV
ncbi:MAG: hypothetical protein JWN34_1420, partial [Bryobacterales bacterium]|nr:hypothetical protein [Bryobacterales bacterium]